MKLEAACDSTTYGVEIKEGPGDNEVTVHLADGSRTRSFSIQLLDVSGERWILSTDGVIHDLLIRQTDDSVLVEKDQDSWSVSINSPKDRLRSGGAGLETEGLVTVRGQMPGKVVRLLKMTGDAVAAGEGVVIVEAMKMQNEIRSPVEGTIVACPLQEGQSVQSGDILFEVE